MMGRKKFVGALVVGTMSAAPAMADVFSDSIVQQLERQGFRSISTERTWLGRTRITAEGRSGQREIIVNPNTGEILRDLLLTTERDGDGNGGLVNVSKGDDRSRDANDDDDDKSDDNGGKSSDRSGSGRDGSGSGSNGGGSNGGDSD